jgi:trehalose 2-sulfotransferase
MPRYDSYVICTSPRSGSTLLCKLLASTGVAGNPKSYFHEPSIADWLDGVGAELCDLADERSALETAFQMIVAEGSLDTGMFGFRLQRHSFDFFTEKLAVLHPGRSSDLERFRAAFGRTAFVHLTRGDKVEQAVSFVKAQQTGLWHRAADGTELERLAPPQEPAYDFVEIGKCVEEFISFDRQWESWFVSEGIEPVRITYDALSASPVETLRHILEELGVDGEAAKGVAPGTARLADKTNLEWIQRFRSEQGSLSFAE